MLAAFVGLGLITVLPLPPSLLDWLAPATAQLYRDVLPGWPGGGGWSTWRSLAVDPYAVCTTLSTLAVGFGVYLVLAGYPWGDEAARARAFGRVFLAMLGAGAVTRAAGPLPGGGRQRSRALGHRRGRSRAAASRAPSSIRTTSRAGSR